MESRSLCGIEYRRQFSDAGLSVISGYEDEETYYDALKKDAGEFGLKALTPTLENPIVKRNRLFYFAAGCLVIALGLSSRRHAAVWPVFFAQYAGDMLWTVMVFLGVGFLEPQWSSFRVAGTALLVSYSIEISQIYHAPWLDSIRHTRLGGLVLGYGFLWSDVACYTAGVALCAAIEIGSWKARAFVTERRSKTARIPNRLEG